MIVWFKKKVCSSFDMHDKKACAAWWRRPKKKKNYCANTTEPPLKIHKKKHKDEHQNFWNINWSDNNKI